MVQPYKVPLCGNKYSEKKEAWTSKASAGDLLVCSEERQCHIEN